VKKVEMVLIETDEADETQKRWDCESIISNALHIILLCSFYLGTYSNLDNHPRLIIEGDQKIKKIQLSEKMGMPTGVLPKKKKEKAPEVKENQGKTRPKEEGAEEKKVRKQQIKEAKKVF
jgi:hypothetical protein